jgi:hypothetical protein
VSNEEPSYGLTLAVLGLLVHRATPPPNHPARLRRHLEPLLRACGVGVASLSHLWLPNQIAFTLCLRLPPDGALHTVRCLVARDPKRGEGSPDEEDLFGECVATEIAWRIVVYLVSRPRLLRAGTDAEGRWREEGTTGAKDGG